VVHPVTLASDIPAVQRPLLRGMLHAAAFIVSLVVGALFIANAPAGHVVGAAVFAATVSLMLGTSALYHVVTWPPRPRLWMRRADHAALFILIAGTCTPVALYALSGAWRVSVLAVVWGGAVSAAVAKFAWVGAPRRMSVVIGIALGWVSVVALPQLAHTAGLTPLFLLLAGGLAYTAGAVVYATRRPNPAPRVFGYHEVFHALTIVALGFQYVAIAVYIVHAT
jgi:hemolysin III